MPVDVHLLPVLRYLQYNYVSPRRPVDILVHDFRQPILVRPRLEPVALLRLFVPVVLSARLRPTFHVLPVLLQHLLQSFRVRYTALARISHQLFLQLLRLRIEILLAVRNCRNAARTSG